MKELWTPPKELHLPPPTMIGFLLEVGAWDAKGRLIYQERCPSRSPVKQLLQFILANFCATDLTIKDQGGTNRSSGNLMMSIVATAGADYMGTLIGTDNTPVDITDYALVAQIAGGSGAGQMVHQVQEFDATVTVADPDCTFDFWRNFNNNSGASITVKETAVYTRDGSGPWFFCLVRDVPAEIVVPNGGGCYVKYTAKITE